MKKLVAAFLFVSASGLAHNSYTGGFSSAPGSLTCASSCHGGTGGTLSVTGFPSSYTPGHAYRIVVKHTGGSAIVNFNATTRVGSGSTVAGTFAAVTNTALYSGADGGVYASPHAIDSAVFNWTAPAKGSGQVSLYAAGFQGSTSSSNGQSSSVVNTASETTTGVATGRDVPGVFTLSQNYPDPFNPSTNITYELPVASNVDLRIFDAVGREVSVLVHQMQGAGTYEVKFNGSNLASGVYFYRLQADGFVASRKLLLMR